MTSVVCQMSRQGTDHSVLLLCCPEIQNVKHNSGSAHNQWVKYLGLGGIVRTPQGAQSPPRAKPCTNGIVRLPLLSAPLQTAKIELCNTILITHFCNFEVFHSIKTEIGVYFYDSTAHLCSLQLIFSQARQANSVWETTLLRAQKLRCHLEIPRGFSTYRLKQTQISENSSNPDSYFLQPKWHPTKIKNLCLKQTQD